MFGTQGRTRNRTRDLPKKGSAFITSSDHWRMLIRSTLWPPLPLFCNYPHVKSMLNTARERWWARIFELLPWYCQTRLRTDTPVWRSADGPDQAVLSVRMSLLIVCAPLRAAASVRCHGWPPSFPFTTPQLHYDQLEKLAVGDEATRVRTNCWYMSVSSQRNKGRIRFRSKSTTGCIPDEMHTG